MDKETKKMRSCCRLCEWYSPVDVAGGKCEALPPKPFLFPGAGQAIRVESIHPPVQANNKACALFRDDLALKDGRSPQKSRPRR